MASGTFHSNASWSLTSDGTLTISGTGSLYSKPYSEYADQIKKVVIKNGITDIGDNPFCDLKNLTSVTIPESVTSIGSTSFWGCSSLNKIDLPDNLQHLGTAFCGTGYWNNAANWTNGVLYLDGWVVDADGRKVKGHVVIPEGTVGIASDTFGEFYPSDQGYEEGYRSAERSICKNLTGVSLPSTLRYICSGAFADCPNLSEVRIAEGLYGVESYAFAWCPKLTSITFPKSLYGLSDNIFAGMSITVTFKGNAPHDWDGQNGAGWYYDVWTNNENLHITVNYPDNNSTWTSHVTSNVNTGTYSLTWVPVCGSHDLNIARTAATTTKDGKLVYQCRKCGAIVKTQTIRRLKTVRLSKTTFTYTGKVQKPTVTLLDSAGNKISSSNYKITYSSGCKNVGKYTIKITLRGNYKGTITRSFVINPKTTSISKLVSGSKKFTVIWKRQSTQTSGYQIQYALTSKFTGAVTKTVKSGISYTFKNLKASRKYYVRIRTYKTVSGKNYYSSWSKVKTVTTKK